MYGGMCVSSFASGLIELTALASKAGMGLGHYFLTNESLINRARNTILAHFYASRATHLLWIDADVGFRAADVMRLVAANVDMVCGAYPMKTTRVAHDTYAAKPKDGASSKPHPMGGTLVEIDRPATGFLLMSRAAVSRMRDAYRGELSYVNRHNEMNGVDMVGLFECMILEENGERHLLSEDYAFAERWRRIGGTTWLDPSIKLTHTGTHVFDAPAIGEFLSIH